MWGTLICHPFYLTFLLLSCTHNWSHHGWWGIPTQKRTWWQGGIGGGQWVLRMPKKGCNQCIKILKSADWQFAHRRKSPMIATFLHSNQQKNNNGLSGHKSQPQQGQSPALLHQWAVQGPIIVPWNSLTFCRQSAHPLHFHLFWISWYYYMNQETLVDLHGPKNGPYKVDFRVPSRSILINFPHRPLDNGKTYIYSLVCAQSNIWSHPFWFSIWQLPPPQPCFED